jgi:hypothetical protein
MGNNLIDGISIICGRLKNFNLNTKNLLLVPQDEQRSRKAGTRHYIGNFSFILISGI